MANSRDFDEAARAWVVRTHDPDFTGWEEFTLWLEEDPQHAVAYDEVCASIDEAAQLVRTSGPANDDLPVPVSGNWISRRGFGAAIAASLCLFVAVATLWPWSAGNRDFYQVTAQPGEMRAIALAPGSSIELAGGSAITLDRADPRFARLEQGHALFTVRHDVQAPFTVEVGDDRLVDLGTVFEVGSSAEGLELRVSEGAVMFNPSKQAVEVRKGQLLRKDKARDKVTLSSSSAMDGGWEAGRLTFQDSTLGTIGRRLSQATGLDFTVDPSAQQQRLSGSIEIASIGKSPRSLGPLLGVEVVRDHDAWRLSLP